MTILAALLLAAPLPQAPPLQPPLTPPPLSVATPDCPAPAPLAEPWTSWRQSGDAVAGAQPQGAPALSLGKPVTATLTPADYVHVAAPPAHLPQQAQRLQHGLRSHQGQGGLFALSLRQAARVGIALSAGAWVDVMDGDSLIASVDHGHGPDCSGIRKIVWFDLAAGRHIVQISGAQDRTIRIMAADAQANRPTVTKGNSAKRR